MQKEGLPSHPLLTPEEVKGLIGDDPPSVEVAPEMVADYPTERKRQKLLELIDAATPKEIENLWEDIMGKDAQP